MSNPNAVLITHYLTSLLRALDEAQREGKMKHCKRSDGTDRAYFHTKEKADAFASDPANVAYHDDVTTFCTALDSFTCHVPIG